IKYLTNFHKEKKAPINYFDSVTVIGDSLSDCKGRMLNKSFGLLPRANQYHNGKFTNGGTWSEFLTMSNLMKSSKQSATEVKLINKAEGGSPSAAYLKRTFSPKFAILSNMQKQIKNLTFDEKNLGIVFLGANDYMTYGKKDVDLVIADQQKNIEKMIARGAKNLVVMGIPDLSLTPSAKKLIPEKREHLQKISAEHNKKLELMAATLIMKNLSKIKYFDVNEVLTNVMNTADSINTEKPGSYNTSQAFSDGYI
ncbi:SGNH/GDSL hydrolase family protein, partial [Xanthomonas citri pv. mangiferaeindicae]|uniref:SGNH/GDSL hydrolase family protein n=1 Tax=Xanthomonas citri TaxID=346 RepID=UPI003F7F5B8D